MVATVNHTSVAISPCMWLSNHYTALLKLYPQNIMLYVSYTSVLKKAQGRVSLARKRSEPGLFIWAILSYCANIVWDQTF